MQIGEIILCPFPFTNLTSNKLRPCVVIASFKNNDLIALAISTKKHNDGVKFSNNNLNSGKIPLDSYIRISRVVTLHEDLIKRRVAQINMKTMNSVLLKFINQFKNA